MFGYRRMAFLRFVYKCDAVECAPMTRRALMSTRMRNINCPTLRNDGAEWCSAVRHRCCCRQCKCYWQRSMFFVVSIVVRLENIHCIFWLAYYTRLRRPVGSHSWLVRWCSLSPPPNKFKVHAISDTADATAIREMLTTIWQKLLLLFLLCNSDYSHGIFY